MHLLIYYEDVDQLDERLISVWCGMDQSVVNHAIDEWRRCRPVSMLKADILNIAYDCYSQNYNTKWQHCKFDNWR